MTLDPGALFLSFVLGGIGLILFVYGKKQDRWPQLAAGLAYMIYPYFIENVLLSLGVAAAIGVALWWAIREGY